MSSNATPKQRKHLTHRRARRPGRTERTQLAEGEPQDADLQPASDPGAFIDPAIVEAAGVSEADVTALAEPARLKVDERARLYRRGAPFPDVLDRTVLVVDDGIATGGTMRAAIRALRLARAGRVVVAAP